MANLELLMRSLSFIEDHLDDEIQTEDIAAACYASKSALEKVFKYTTHFSVHDYVIRRRMTLAARCLVSNPAMSILDVAVQYGYSSHEAFTRTFFQVWNCTPSQLRETYGDSSRLPVLFPKLEGVYQLEGETYMRRRVDISEMYDYFKEHKDNYFVLGDISHLVPINDLSQKLGDIAILESMNRMIKCSGEDDITFRIGGDEFVTLTNSADESYAEQIKEKILAMNGELISYEDLSTPLSLHVCTCKMDMKLLKYDELFNQLHKKLRDFKGN